MSKNPYEILRRPLITEKSTTEKETSNKLVFEVALRANKIEIKHAVEQMFKVNVLDVTTMTMRGKKKRVGRSLGKKSDWKKAVVTLKEGERIDFFEGV